MSLTQKVWKTPFNVIIYFYVTNLSNILIINKIWLSIIWSIIYDNMICYSSEMNRYITTEF